MRQHKHSGWFNTKTASLLALALWPVAPRAAPAPSPAGLSVHTYAGLTITGAVGTVYSIEYATDLANTNNWLLLTNVMLLCNPHLCFDPSSAGSAKRFYRALAWATNQALANMAFIPGGPFTMGDAFGEGATNERPTHSVYVSAFYMDKYEVTKALWDEVHQWATNHGYSFTSVGKGKAANHPVQSVSWYDAVKWCNARSEKEGRIPAYYTSAAQTTVYRTGTTTVQSGWVKWNAGYRLPTEAEWEKAARGGVNGRRFPWSDTDNITHSRANYWSTTNYVYDTSPTRGFHPSFQANGLPYTSPVGSFPPNGYGLYDMAGNVIEWCSDWLDDAYYSWSPATDPRGSPSGYGPLLRGGTWDSYANSSRIARRTTFSPPTGSNNFVGFRSILPLGQP